MKHPSWAKLVQLVNSAPPVVKITPQVHTVSPQVPTPVAVAETPAVPASATRQRSATTESTGPGVSRQRTATMSSAVPRRRLDTDAPSTDEVMAKLAAELPHVLQQIEGILARAEPCAYAEADALRVHLRFLCKYRSDSLSSCLFM